ncbi:MAG: hypothetical protein KHX03_04080 [Clostridium sp.]|nr:hypothetical protein [Clostridium sp.]
MDEKYLILEQYRIYNEMKERFIDRSFMINRFFMIFSAIFMFALIFVKMILPAQYFLLLALEVFGIASCIMWISNQDAYASIIKIKYNSVIEKLEEDLPKAPNKDEYKELTDRRSNKRVILVKDIQKWFAILLMFVFLGNGLIDIANSIFSQLFNA